MTLAQAPSDPSPFVPASGATTYRALTADAVWRAWGDELAVYEGRSARTHLLADGHAELFGLLADRAAPATLADIARAFTDATTADAPADAPVDTLTPDELRSLQDLVHELVDLGLVEAGVA